MSYTRLNKPMKYVDYDVSFSFNGGTPGSRAGIVDTSIGITGYVPVAALLVELYHETDVFPTIQIEGNVLRVLFHYATNTAASGTLTFRVLYMP